VVDAATGDVTLHASSMQAYTPEAYTELLAEAGFGSPRWYASLAGDGGPVQEGLVALVTEPQEPAVACLD